MPRDHWPLPIEICRDGLGIDDPKEGHPEVQLGRKPSLNALFTHDPETRDRRDACSLVVRLGKAYESRQARRRRALRAGGAAINPTARRIAQKAR